MIILLINSAFLWKKDKMFPSYDECVVIRVDDGLNSQDQPDVGGAPGLQGEKGYDIQVIQDKYYFALCLCCAIFVMDSVNIRNKANILNLLWLGFSSFPT